MSKKLSIVNSIHDSRDQSVLELMDALSSLEQLASLTPIDTWNYHLLQMVHTRLNDSIVGILKHVDFGSQTVDANQS